MKRRSFLLRGASALAFPALASAQAIPQGATVKLLVGAPAGGPLDLVARAFGQQLAKGLQVVVIVDNKSGAAGTLAANQVMRAAPDGLTLMLTVDTPVTLLPHTMQLPYSFERDFTPVGRLVDGGVALTVHSSVPAQKVSELIEFGRRNPDKMVYCSFGNGTSSHMYGELLAQQMGVKMVHVPFRGSADSVRELVAGRCLLSFESTSATGRFVEQGALRHLAVAGENRRKLLPAIPTMAEQGFAGYEVRSWIGVFAPAKMPPPVLAQLEAAIQQVRQSEEFGTAMNRAFFEVAGPEDSAAFGSRIGRESQTWARMLKDLKIQLQ